MQIDLSILILTAISIGTIHTLIGPDHYLPFVAMARSGGWSIKRTLQITLFCGLGHVLSSVLLGLIGIGMGAEMARLGLLDEFRGALAAYGLIVFGAAYTAYGLYRATRKGHHHTSGKGGSITPWALFVIFVLGPCEPLVPILMYPAAQVGLGAALLVALAFALSTILTMLLMVTISLYGLKSISLKGFERYTHAMAGVAVLLCGVTIQFLGL